MRDLLATLRRAQATRGRSMTSHEWAATTTRHYQANLVEFADFVTPLGAIEAFIACGRARIDAAGGSVWEDTPDAHRIWLATTRSLLDSLRRSGPLTETCLVSVEKLIALASRPAIEAEEAE
jgi:hypothetical protein